jgi:hypothetical protein
VVENEAGQHRPGFNFSFSASWKSALKPIEISITWMEEVFQTREKDKRKNKFESD